MKNYALYVRVSFGEYNILNINEEELEVVLAAYKAGKSDFYLSGTKYSLSNLNEIKIFEVPEPKEFENWLDLAIATKKIGYDIDGTIILKPSDLKLPGRDVTKFFIKHDYGFGLEEISKSKFSNNEMNIFISHSSEDALMAEKIINLIRKSLNIDSSKIRCTSVEGYKLPTGASTEEQLKKEIHSSKVFIALLTKVSISSVFVLFELGARWSTGYPLLPLICDPEGTSLLSGPLKNINALNANNASDILQFIEDLGKHLNLRVEPASSYHKEVEELNFINKIKPLAIDKSNNNSSVSGKKLSNKGYSENTNNETELNETNNIIKKQAQIAWPDDYTMQINEIKRQKEAFEDLSKGRPSDLTEEEFFRIRERAKVSWPLDFVMQADEEKRQIGSLRMLKDM